MTTGRYDQLVNSQWPPTLPVITRDEAERAARRLYRHFGSKRHGNAKMHRDLSFNGNVRRCWISLRPTGWRTKGWPRLVHDLSHRIHERRAPDLRPHGGGHAYLEQEMVQYVKLKPLPKTKPTLDQKRTTRLQQIETSIKRWQTKAKRADTAIRKLTRERKRLHKVAPAWEGT